MTTKVMIVEDEAVSALFLRTMLERRGFEITALVDSGEDAMEKAQTDAPDVVIMDIRLRGEINGIQAADHIYRHTGIESIFISAYAREELRKRFPLSNSCRLISKPVEEHALMAAIADVSADSAGVISN